MLVDIDDRVYHDFMEWSLANGMSEDDALKYINRAFRDKFMTDKYGDLNDKFDKPTLKQEPKPEPTKAVQPEPEPEPMTEPEVNEPNVEPVQEAKPKPKRKVLKSK